MSGDDLMDLSGDHTNENDVTQIPLTTLVFEAKDLESLSAAQRKDLLWLDNTLEPIVKTLKSGTDASKQLARYVLQAKKYLIKYYPEITISQAAAHPVMFGTISSSL